ncbi:MAG: ZIP family metal transporter [Oscillospiraceae bacterium]|nr:ZIP family metal transporter [Oscillospiraceae bacterium]
MYALLLSALAGIGGTGVGGILAIILGKTSQKLNCWLLSFAGGVMTSIVFFTLIPEAVDHSGILYTLLWMSLGIIVVMILNHVVDRLTGGDEPTIKIHRSTEELYHETGVIKQQHDMVKSGILMFVAMALHNIPEGIVVGASGSHDIQLGLLMSVIIALHNMPEGMVVAAPLVTAGFSPLKVIFITSLSGATELLGGIIGISMGALSNQFLALSLAFAGGAMLYVTFCEILPQSIIMTENRSTTFVTLVGIIAGMLLASYH